MISPFAIEYQEPGGGQFFKLNNRLSFTPGTSSVHPSQQNPTTLCPIQKFRWVHFPRNAEMPGLFTYRVTPVFMDSAAQLSYGEPQQSNRSTSTARAVVLRRRSSTMKSTMLIIDRRSVRLSSQRRLCVS